MAHVHDGHTSAFAPFGGGLPASKELLDVSLPDVTRFTLAEAGSIRLETAEPEPCLIGVERPDGTIRTLGILDPAASTYDPETRTGTISIAPDPTDAINGVPLSQWLAAQHTPEENQVKVVPSVREKGQMPTFDQAVTAAADALEGARTATSSQASGTRVEVARSYMDLAALIDRRERGLK